MTLDLIEPNIHPILVHFAYALTVVAAGLYGLALVPRFRLRPGLSAAADWSLFIAGISVLLTIAAGFQAYYSVAHDGPSHEAMTTHRNWAVPTGTLVILLAGWRWAKRARKPSTALSSAVIASAALLNVTAWWGGHLVYSYGLGVESLPDAGSGDGHDHEHAGEASSTAGGAHPHDDGDDPGQHDGGGTASQAARDNAGQVPIPPKNASVDVDRASPATTADSLAVAYGAGDEAALRSLLADDLLVAEGGGVEDGLAAYASHHMGSDLAASEERKLTRTARSVQPLGSGAALVVTTYLVESSGSNDDRPLVETAVMVEEQDGWIVTHLHWSFGAAGSVPNDKTGKPVAGDDAPHGEPGHAH